MTVVGLGLVLSQGIAAFTGRASDPVLYTGLALTGAGAIHNVRLILGDGESGTGRRSSRRPGAGPSASSSSPPEATGEQRE